MSRMFFIPTPEGPQIMTTWNVFVGCYHDCTYCNARKAALTRLRHFPRYKSGFRPHLVKELLATRFRPSQFVFVAYMGDIAWATIMEVDKIIKVIRQFPDTTFLFLTKDPYRYSEWQRIINFPKNVYLGTTIETNRDNGLNRAPTPYRRYYDLARIKHPQKFLSIEPIMDFDVGELINWVSDINPSIIEVGADNYHNNLPEPPWGKVLELLRNLRQLCPVVVEKTGLERLKK